MIKYLDYYFVKTILFVWLKSMELPFEDIKAVPLDSSMVHIKVYGYSIATRLYMNNVHCRKLKGVPPILFTCYESIDMSFNIILAS